MKIAIINQHVIDHVAGSEIQCDLMATELARRGHRVSYIAPGSKRRDTASLPRPYVIVPVPYEKKAVVQAVRDDSPDVVYWRSCRDLFVQCAQAIAQIDTPLVFAVSHIHDVAPWTRIRQRIEGPADVARCARDIVRGIFQQRVYRHVAAMTTLNEEYLECLRSPVREYVPNSMATDYVPFEWPRPYCIWVANLKVAKQPEKVVQLAREIADLPLDVLMVGKLQDRRFAWLENRMDVPDNFHYLGPASPEEVNGMVRGSVLHVHTCLPEGFGNIFIQAWLQGRTSVSLAFDPGGLMESTGIGRCAHGDWNRFVKDVRELATAPGVRATLERKAVSLAVASFSIASSADRVESVFRTVVERRRHERQSPAS